MNEVEKLSVTLINNCWMRFLSIFESGMSKVEVLASADTTNSEDSKETESNNFFVIHRFEENNDKHTIAWNIVRHCSWKSCITRATYTLVSHLIADN